MSLTDFPQIINVFRTDFLTSTCPLSSVISDIKSEKLLLHYYMLSLQSPGALPIPFSLSLFGSCRMYIVHGMCLFWGMFTARVLACCAACGVLPVCCSFLRLTAFHPGSCLPRFPSCCWNYWR